MSDAVCDSALRDIQFHELVNDIGEQIEAVPALCLRSSRRVDGGGAHTADVTVELVFNHPPLDARPTELEVINNLAALVIFAEACRKAFVTTFWCWAVDNRVYRKTRLPAYGMTFGDSF